MKFYLNLWLCSDRRHFINKIPLIIFEKKLLIVFLGDIDISSAEFQRIGTSCICARISLFSSSADSGVECLK
jgi:hypothetical protein